VAGWSVVVVEVRPAAQPPKGPQPVAQPRWVSAQLEVVQSEAEQPPTEPQPVEVEPPRWVEV